MKPIFVPIRPSAFLVVLEMIKIGKVSVSQENTFDDIIITSNVEGSEIDSVVTI